MLKKTFGVPQAQAKVLLTNGAAAPGKQTAVSAAHLLTIAERSRQLGTGPQQRGTGLLG
jgi:hypothetical protein